MSNHIDKPTISLLLKLLRKAFIEAERDFKKTDTRDSIVNEIFRRQGIKEAYDYIENIEQNGISFAKELLKD